MLDRRKLLLATSALLFASPATQAQTRVSRVIAGAIFEPRRFGAKGDGRTLDTPAINHAIEAASRSGGGVVYLSGGTFLSGTIFLKSNVTLYIEAGATLLGSTELTRYPPQPGPNPDPLAGENQHHLIFARDAHNIALAGGRHHRRTGANLLAAGAAR
jgi:polygalacturonase